MNNQSNVRNNSLTIALVLKTLRELSSNQFKDQVSFFVALFSSYHDYRSQRIKYEFRTSQSIVSGLLSNKEKLPRHMYAFYMSHNGSTRLRNDIRKYLNEVIATERQRQLHLSELLLLAQESNNLEPMDKNFILDYCHDECEDYLEELFFRMLFVLIREPATVRSV